MRKKFGMAMVAALLAAPVAVHAQGIFGGMEYGLFCSKRLFCRVSGCKIGSHFWPQHALHDSKKSYLALGGEQQLGYSISLAAFISRLPAAR